MSAQPSLLDRVSPLPGTRQCCPMCKQRLPLVSAHLLNEVLISGLEKLRNAGGGPCQLNELNLTTNEHGNSNKWAHFGLAVRVEINQKLTSKWLLTDTGRRFLRGELSLPKKVWTRRIDGEIKVVDREGSITVKEISPEVWERGNYAREARVA